MTGAQVRAIAARIMIPGVAHFIWLGREFPWVHALAIRSCAERGGFERVVLHCSDDLGGARWWPEVARLPAVEMRPIEPAPLFRAVPDDGDALLALYRRLRRPAPMADMLRAAILATEGGVYLDMDTVTVADLNDLRARAGVFFGQERIALPAAVVRSGRPDVQLAMLVRLGFRELCRQRAGGWRIFRRFEHLYPLAPNNAVFGGAPGHPFLRELLHRMVALPPGRAMARCTLGPHLLQEAVTAATDPSVLAVPPALFYPLAPEISQHWFREDSGARAADLLLPETRVVHWYASVRSQRLASALTPERVRALAGRQPFSELVAPFAG